MKQESATPDTLQDDLTCLMLMAMGMAANGGDHPSCLNGIQRACHLARAAGLTEARIVDAVRVCADRIPETMSEALIDNLSRFMRYIEAQGVKLRAEYAARN